MMNEQTKETKKARSSAVAVNTNKRKKRKKSGACRGSGRDDNARTGCDAGRLQVLHRWDMGIQSLGRWARTPAQHWIFRPMLVEDSESVKIALQDCFTW